MIRSGTWRTAEKVSPGAGARPRTLERALELGALLEEGRKRGLDLLNGLCPERSAHPEAQGEATHARTRAQ